jgi:hypothetical protein
MVSRYAEFTVTQMVLAVTFCAQKEQELAEVKEHVVMVLN